jgi:hypothetical protein
MSPPYLSRFPQKLGAAKESFREQAQLSAPIFSSGRVPMSAVTRLRTCLVQGRTISYREAGDVSAPAILLLHGLPGSSAEYDALIRAWADKLHLIAPDYIRFGASEAPEPGVFAYTFENLTDYVAGLIEAIGIGRHVLQRPPFLPGRPRRSPTGEVSCPMTTRWRLSPRALSLSTEWEAASRTQPLPGRSGKAQKVVVKQGGRRRKIREIA